MVRKVISLACFVFLVVLSGSVSAATYTVCSSGCDYTSIQAAVNVASDGDTISVAAGTYTENVDVTKSVNIVGAGADVTTVQAASSSGTIFYVTASNVKISGFTVTGSSGYTGIHLRGVSNSNISKNIVSNSFYGIYLLSSSNNTIINNVANSNYDVGIVLVSSNYNNITNNIANSNTGSYMEESGIWLHSSSYNTLTGNIVSNNGAYGLDLYYSGNNTIYNNLFNNANNIYFIGTDTATWNTTKQAGTNIIGGSYLGGNFWANPSGTGFSEMCADADSDGICDSSYTPAAGNVDYLPLAKDVGSDFTPPEITIISPIGKTYNMTSIVLNVTTSETTNVTYSLNGAGNVSLYNESTGGDQTITAAEGFNNITFYALDAAENLNSIIVYFTVDATLSCGDTIYDDTVLTDDLSGCAGDGLIIGGADDITLDCAGHSIIGAPGATGIYISERNNATIRNCVLKTFDKGIVISNSDNNTIVNNTLTDSWGILGISLESSDYNIMINNSVSSKSAYGIVQYTSNYNTISNNTVTDNNDKGIYITGTPPGGGDYEDCSHSNISGNVVSNNGYGIYLDNEDNNLVTENYVYANTYGIFLSNSWSNSIYHNNFVNNSNQAYDSRIDNIWDAGYPSGGNYWSDYDTPAEGCNDLNSDGICDIPYSISGGSNQDRYPVTQQNGWLSIVEDWKLPTITSASPQNRTYTTTSIDLNVSADETIDIWMYNLNSAGNTTFTPNTTITGGEGLNNIVVYATDTAGNTNSSTVHFTVDLPPRITIITPQNIVYNTSSVDLNYSVEDESGIDWVGYSLDGQGNVTLIANITLIGLSEGQHNVTIYANDAAGNLNSTTKYFTVDLLPPRITIITPQNIVYNTSSVDLNYSVEDESGIDWVGYSLDGQGNVSGEITTFSEGSSIKKITFTSAGSDTSTYIKVPKNATVTSAVMNVGYEEYAGTTLIDDSEDAYGCSGSFAQPCTNAVDENWGTQAQCYSTFSDPERHWSCYVYENYTFPSGVSAADWTFLYDLEYRAKIKIDYFSYATNDWENIYSVTGGLDGIHPSSPITIFLPNNAIGDTLQIRTNFSSRGTPGSYSKARYKEGEVTWHFYNVIYNYPTNLSIDTANDGITDWSMPGELNSANPYQPVDLNITAIQNYVDSNSADGFVLVPLVISSDTAGVVQLDALSVKYHSSHSNSKEYYYNTKLTSLANGRHNVTVYASDVAGNMNSSTVYFTVTVDVPPTTTTTTTTTTSTTVQMTTTTTTAPPTTTTTTLPPGNVGNTGNVGNVDNGGNVGNVGNFDGNYDGNVGNVGNFDGNYDGNTGNVGGNVGNVDDSADISIVTTSTDLASRLWQRLSGSGR